MSLIVDLELHLTLVLEKGVLGRQQLPLCFISMV